ncbi:universal stress protein [Roseateles sp.]|uniref:universal stress protein n=1 Tax=Roseateles sp. TaxID=1971397 RepID=UPI0025F56D4D|nr:universal stress protein [Roseateles sp.]MBV8036878.1 universal stress protein [Roseateles sp.]
MENVFKHVLVATDGSLLADKAIQLALRLGGGARVTALLVMHDYGLSDYLQAVVSSRPDATELREEILAEGRRLLDEAVVRAVQGDTRVERRVVISGKSPRHEIVATAQRENCDLIVMSSHGLGGKMAHLLGSQSQGVLSMATVPVMIVR